jgi:hypothetical protein
MGSDLSQAALACSGRTGPGVDMSMDTLGLLRLSRFHIYPIAWAKTVPTTVPMMQ